MFFMLFFGALSLKATSIKVNYNKIPPVAATTKTEQRSVSVEVQAPISIPELVRIWQEDKHKAEKKAEIIDSTVSLIDPKTTDDKHLRTIDKLVKLWREKYGSEETSPEITGQGAG